MQLHILIQIGEYQKALEKLDFVLSIPGWLSVNKMKLDKRIDPLRHNPRFLKIKKKYNH